MLQQGNIGEGSALEAARTQLEYWKRECEAARAANDAARLAQCERFIRQCELVIAALTSS